MGSPPGVESPHSLICIVRKFGALSASRSLAIRLSLLFFWLFAGLGLYLPFFPVFLAGRGLSPDEIALVLFVPIVIRAAAAPFVSGLADRRIDPALFLSLSSLAIGGLFALTAFVSGLIPLLILAALIAVLQSASIPLSDALTIKAAQTHQGLHYGRIRLWGSVSFFLANLGGGFLLAHFGGVSIPLAIGVMTAVVLPVLLPLRERTGRATADVVGPRVSLPRFLLVIFAAAALIHASHAFLNAFGSLVWAAQDYGAEMIGAIWALNILGEVVLFWFFGSAIGPRFPAFAFLMVGGGVAVMRWVAMGFSPGPVVLALCQLSHGLTFGATHLGSIALVARFAPEGARSRAQGLMSAMNGALVSAGTLASGWLFTHLGAAGFWAMVPLALAGFALAAWCAWRQPQSAREGG